MGGASLFVFLREAADRVRRKLRRQRKLCHLPGASLWEAWEVKERPAHFRDIANERVSYQIFKERIRAALAAHDLNTCT
jgi:hypothetical protein